MEKNAQLLKLLGDKTRLTIVRLLSYSECCVCEFVEIFQMSQPAISQHMKKLKDAGVVKEKRKGQWIFYSLNEHADQYAYLQTILKDLPDLHFLIEDLDQKGKRISCC
ncbi:ArsR/SmtB family transcription factor [Falsibacillus albus]|uniref:ArsR family transcriptional regulator n=1 Tax=Falsibacillus albus TaxID=2478915 RepID=A0A3L7K0Y4_9BACI|nr:metalloregulator ArsR/SmtB family transcription factor [Falsibacillus albus]RLQ96733.1 ArsR family transcriptional regulator [Falsibacillus albus]